MTIANNYVPIRQEANGNTKSFTFDFRILDDDYLVVYQEIGGKQTVVDSSDYTVNAQEVGGTVDFNMAPVAGSYIIITRDVPLDQLTPYRTSSGFPANRVEENLDKLTAITQQLNEAVNRAPKLPVGTAGVDVTLPLPDAGKAIIWNDEGNGFVNSKDKFDDIVTDATEQANIATQKAAEASASATAAAGSATTAAGSAEQAEEAWNSIEMYKKFNPYFLNNVDVVPNQFVADSTYSGYPWKALVANVDTHLPYKNGMNCYGFVTFAPQDINSGNFAPVASFGVGYVVADSTQMRCSIYAKEKPTEIFVIPTIAFYLGSYNQ